LIVSSKKKVGIIALIAPVLLSMPILAGAWGVTGHRYANGLAVDSLPAELKPLYLANRAWIVEHSSDPDKWRNKNKAEAPYHFIDLDTWQDKEPKVSAEDFPEDYWVACSLFGKEAVDKNGIVPWRVGQYYHKLVAAFKKRDARAIIEISTFMGHYVADIHVPFHAVANYDGQLTGQKGIHARFESVMVDKQIKVQELKAQTPEMITNPVGSMFQWAKLSFKRHFDVLKSDKEAVTTDAKFGDDYYKLLGEKSRPIAVAALEESGTHLASLWLSAWIAAGKPELPTPADVHTGEPLDAPTTDPDLPKTPMEQKPAEQKPALKN